MTTMNRIRAWSFAAFLGALALGDWEIQRLVADGEEAGIPKAVVNGVTVTGAVVDITVGDKLEKHWVLSLEGDGKGEMTIECTKTVWNPMSRMPARPEALWSRAVAFDTSASRTLDLGPVPAADKALLFAIQLAPPCNESAGEFVPKFRLAAITPSFGGEDEVPVDVKPPVVEKQKDVTK